MRSCRYWVFPSTDCTPYRSSSGNMLHTSVRRVCRTTYPNKNRLQFLSRMQGVPPRSESFFHWRQADLLPPFVLHCHLRRHTTKKVDRMFLKRHVWIGSYPSHPSYCSSPCPSSCYYQEGFIVVSVYDTKLKLLYKSAKFI